MTMTLQLTGGYPYCVRAPMALIPGRYNVIIKQWVNAITVAKDLEVKKGQVSSVDIETGFVVKRPLITWLVTGLSDLGKPAPF